MGVVATWFWIGFLPQMFFWIGFTVMIGSLFGSMALLFAGSRPQEAAANLKRKAASS
jgi:hypothetical protein